MSCRPPLADYPQPILVIRSAVQLATLMLLEESSQGVEEVGQVSGVGHDRGS